MQVNNGIRDKLFFTRIGERDNTTISIGEAPRGCIEAYHSAYSVPAEDVATKISVKKHRQYVSVRKQH